MLGAVLAANHRCVRSWIIEADQGETGSRGTVSMQLFNSLIVVVVEENRRAVGRVAGNKLSGTE
jgi:hypothetical protein